MGPDAELKAAWARDSERRRLEQAQLRLRIRLQERQASVAALALLARRQREDVAALEATSATTLLLWLRGEWERRRDAEQAEVDAALAAALDSGARLQQTQGELDAVAARLRTLADTRAALRQQVEAGTPPGHEQVRAVLGSDRRSDALSVAARSLRTVAGRLNDVESGIRRAGQRHDRHGRAALLDSAATMCAAAERALLPAVGVLQDPPEPGAEEIRGFWAGLRVLAANLAAPERKGMDTSALRRQARAVRVQVDPLLQWTHEALGHEVAAGLRLASELDLAWLGGDPRAS